MRLLLLSNSTNVGEEYLRYPLPHIKKFLGEKPLKCLFIPYAAVTFSFDEYERKVKERFKEMGHELVSIHNYKNPVSALQNAEAIVVGGGNTFHLLKLLQQNNLIEPIRIMVKNGIPYIGWSAGSNLACPKISTSNDMPIVEPDGFTGFSLIPFQINPHYTDFVPVGHAGETRDQRIEEFLAANPEKVVLGLREGTMLNYENGKLSLIGPFLGRVFKYKEVPQDFDCKTDLSFLVKG